MLQQRILEVVALYLGNFDVRRNATATVDSAAAVGEFYFPAGIVFVLFTLAIEVIVVERNVGIIPLDQTHTWGVVLRSGQGQTGVLRKRINRLHQPLPKVVSPAIKPRSWS